MGSEGTPHRGAHGFIISRPLPGMGIQGVALLVCGVPLGQTIAPTGRGIPALGNALGMGTPWVWVG